MPCFSPWSSIQNVTAGSSGSPGVIVRDSEWTIALVSGTTRVQMPTNSQVNDRVEIYTALANMGGNAVQVSSATEAIIQAGNAAYQYAISLPLALIKVSSFEWAAL